MSIRTEYTDLFHILKYLTDYFDNHGFSEPKPLPPSILCNIGMMMQPSLFNLYSKDFIILSMIYNDEKFFNEKSQSIIIYHFSSTIYKESFKSDVIDVIDMVKNGKTYQAFRNDNGLLENIARLMNVIYMCDRFLLNEMIYTLIECIEDKYRSDVLELYKIIQEEGFDKAKTYLFDVYFNT